MNDRLVVFGDDNSNNADLAWLWANNHRTWASWHLEIVTADPAFPPIPGRTPHGSRIWEPDKPRRVFREAGFETVRHLTSNEDPRIALGDRTDADLVVVGARGAQGIKGLLLGSTADYLVHHPPSPVVVVRHGATTRSILVCVDNRPPSRRAVETLAALPWVATTSVTVLTVDTDGADAATALRHATDTLEPIGADLENTAASGDRHVHILEVAREFDLVALGTRGTAGWRRRREHSTAATIVRHATNNVLVAPGPHDQTGYSPAP